MSMTNEISFKNILPNKTIKEGSLQYILRLPPYLKNIGHFLHKTQLKD